MASLLCTFLLSGGGGGGGVVFVIDSGRACACSVDHKNVTSVAFKMP